MPSPPGKQWYYMSEPYPGVHKYRKHRNGMETYMYWTDSKQYFFDLDKAIDHMKVRQLTDMILRDD